MSAADHAKAFLRDSRHALVHLFAALDQYRDALAKAQKRVEELERSQKALSDLFMYRDQWSPNANYLYSQYVARLRGLEKHKSEASRQSQQDRLKDALASIGATVESMSALAGTVLQIAKQVLALRFTRKPTLPSARKVGSQSIVELIWEGRNHAMHWDEAEPKPRLKKMLDTLSADLRTKLQVRENNSLSILGALGWQSPEQVIADLSDLVR